MRRPTFAILALASAVFSAALTGCRPGGVLVTFHPDVGDRFVYRVLVSSVTTVDVEGRDTERDEDSLRLTAEHVVLRASRLGTRVRVRLRGAGPTRTFVVNLDRAARLSSVTRVENLPAAALGELGLSEIFPAAAGAAPDRRLRPGERWRIDERVDLPGTAPAQLRGHGRLARLGVQKGRDVATVSTDTHLSLRRRARAAPGRPALRGTQTTRAEAVHALADGAIETADAVTSGTFAVEIAPPRTERGAPIVGRLSIDVHSTTTLLRRD